MYRDNLDTIPTFELPVGYRLRFYKKGDEKIWLTLQEESDDHNVFTANTWEDNWHGDDGALSERMVFLETDNGEVVGSAAAWYDDYFSDKSFREKNWGRVHWVAVAPAYQGRGLSKPMMTLVLRRLADLGHPGAFLTTDIVRSRAIGLYRKFGFMPFTRSDEERRRWTASGL